MKTNVYKRFDPRVMEREERIGINRVLFPQANCLQILVESPSILSLQIFATGPTFLTFNQTIYERNDLMG
jgi:hypothetical protein